MKNKLLSSLCVYSVCSLYRLSRPPSRQNFSYIWFKLLRIPLKANAICLLSILWITIDKIAKPIPPKTLHHCNTFVIFLSLFISFFFGKIVSKFMSAVHNGRTNPSKESAYIDIIARVFLKNTLSLLFVRKIKFNRQVILRQFNQIPTRIRLSAAFRREVSIEKREA